MVLLRRTQHEPGFDRPPDRGRVLAIGSLVLVAALVLITVGVFLGRASVPTATPARPAPIRSVPAPSSTSAGEPAHSKAGAADAAYGYEQTLGSPQFLDKGWRSRLLDRIAVPSARAQLDRQWDVGMTYLEHATRLVSTEHAGSPVIGVTDPIAWKASSYTPGTARIAVWSMSMLGGTAGYPPTASWTTDTVTLQWQHGRWLLSAVHNTPGPTPVADKTTNPTAAGDLISAYRGMTRYTR